MVPVDWLALYVFFSISYSQLFLFYIHAYGVSGGWTTTLENYSERVRLLGLPDFVVLIYFGITLGLKAAAGFLAWKAMNDSLGTDAYDKTDMSAIGATFLISMVAAIAWTKSFFTPPRPFFVAALIFSGIEACVSVISIPYYYSSGTNKTSFVTYGDDNNAAMFLQLGYVLSYSMIVYLCTFYGYFHSGEAK